MYWRIKQSFVFFKSTLSQTIHESASNRPHVQTLPPTRPNLSIHGIAFSHRGQEPGYGDIHAVNNREMIFIISYVSGDMILGAYLLGNMRKLIVKGSRTGLGIKIYLIKYMNKNDLGRQISNEIKGHLRLQYESSYNKAAILQDIPATFKVKILQKLYDPYIKDVHLVEGRALPFIKHIAIEVQEELFLPGEVTIEEGNVADHLYIICYGKLSLVED